MPIFHDTYPRYSTARGAKVDDVDSRPSSTASEGVTDSRPLSRGELIEKIKRGESPTWTLQHNFRQQSSKEDTSPNTSPNAHYSSESSPIPLLPAAELTDEPPRELWHHTDIYQAGLEIARPRSALHTGDFHDEKTHEGGSQDLPPVSTSPPAPWARNFPPPPIVTAAVTTRTSRYEKPRQLSGVPIPRRTQPHGRTVSQSPFSGFVFLPPTSPLVNASSNADIEPPSPLPLSDRTGHDRNNRRHTFSPQSLQTYKAYAVDRFSPLPRGPPQLRKENTYPYQAHQPRRSVGSTSQLLPHSLTPYSPRFGPRPPSISSDVSPLHHAPMVGSYEESILRGRMSTTPSRPLNFVAQIGVLGRGNCKASLRCPPHATIAFPAVFYSYGLGGGRNTENQPSPYVGLVDLEHSLKSHDEEVDGDTSKRRRRPRSPYARQTSLGRSVIASDSSESPMRQRKLEHQKRRSHSPKQLKAPPGGSYRIPPIGQLQIVIKNPHKTAVKLFLVPYDLSDMVSGTKTFIRQRSYSAGPIIDMPLSSRSNLGTDRPEASLSTSDDPRDRPVLRYLVHLNVCCLGKKGSERHYLYKSIRVVFANRVPDGKEKLRNEIQLPEPRYSAYKPSRDSVGTTNMSPFRSSQPLADRRRSAVAALQGGGSMDIMDGLSPTTDIAWQGDSADSMDWTLTAIKPQNDSSRAASSARYEMMADSSATSPVPAVSRAPHQSQPAHLGTSITADTWSGHLMGSSSSTYTTTTVSAEMHNWPREPHSPVSPLDRFRNANGGDDSSFFSAQAADAAETPLRFPRSASPSVSGMPGEGLLSRRFRSLEDRPV